MGKSQGSTPKDIQDILAFAAERHVTVIPEIEMPGHCRAALAAYPWLGCTGELLPVPNNWGCSRTCIARVTIQRWRS